MEFNKKKIIDQYEANGFILIKNFFKKEEMIELKNELFSKINEEKNKFKKRFINFTKNGSINSLHGLDDFECIKMLQKDKRVISFVSSILGIKYDNFGSELFAKPAGTGLSVPTHQDNKYWCLSDDRAFTMWFALDKSNFKNGGIFYYKGSHLLGLLEHEPSNAPGSSQKLKFTKGLVHFKKVFPSLNIGDCLIHNCMVVHGSNKNLTKNSRSGLTLRFKDKANYVRKDLKKAYEKELNKQLKEIK